MENIIKIKQIRQVVSLLAFSYCLLLLTACSSLKEISVESTANSNFDNPVALDIVFVYDSKIIPILSEVYAPQWFNRQPELIRNYGNDIDIVRLQIVPQSFMENVALPEKYKKAKNILLFTNYPKYRGQYMVELSHFKQLKILLLSDNYKLIELDE